METVIRRPKSKEQFSALKAFAKALEVEFETKESTYAPEFLEKIKDVEIEVASGKYITLDPGKSLWEI